MKLNIIVLLGGKSSEREVSLNTGSSFINNLDKNKYNVKAIEIPNNKDKTWIKELIDNPCDLVIIALHGGIGENGGVQGLLECLEIPYIGSQVLGSAIGMNKEITKEILTFNGINTPKKIDINETNISYPVIVKPNTDGSSVGINIVHNIKEFNNAIAEVKKLNEDVLIEEYIDGLEITCGVIEKDSEIIALDVLEIKPQEQFYDYKAKYESDDTKINKANIPDTLRKEIENTAIKAFKVLKAKGYARIDMIIKDNKPYVLEINTLPGMTSHSLIPKSLELKNISYQEFLDDLINETLIKNQ